MYNAVRSTTTSRGNHAAMADLKVCNKIKKVNLPMPAEVLRRFPASREDSFVIKFKTKRLLCFNSQSRPHFYRTILAMAPDARQYLMIYLSDSARQQPNYRNRQRKGYCFQVNLANSVRITKGKIASRISNYLCQDEPHCLFEMEYQFGTITLELDGVKRISEWCPLFLRAFEKTLCPSVQQFCLPPPSPPAAEPSPLQVLPTNQTMMGNTLLPTMTAILASPQNASKSSTAVLSEKQSKDEEDEMRTSENESRSDESRELSRQRRHKKKYKRDKGRRRRKEKPLHKDKGSKHAHNRNGMKKKHNYSSTDEASEERDDWICHSNAKRGNIKESMDDGSLGSNKKDDQLMSSDSDIGAPLASSSLLPIERTNDDREMTTGNGNNTADNIHHTYVDTSATSCLSTSERSLMAASNRRGRNHIVWAPNETKKKNRIRRGTMIINASSSLIHQQSPPKPALGGSRLTPLVPQSYIPRENDGIEDVISCSPSFSETESNRDHGKKNALIRQPTNVPGTVHKTFPGKQLQSAAPMVFMANKKQVRWRSPRREFNNIPRPYQISSSSTYGYVVRQYGFTSNSGAAAVDQQQECRPMETNELVNVRRLFEERICSYLAAEKTSNKNSIPSLKDSEIPRQLKTGADATNRQPKLANGPFPVTNVLPKVCAPPAPPPPPPNFNFNRIRERFQEVSESKA